MSDVMTYDMEIAELDQTFDMELDAAIIGGGGSIALPEDSSGLLAWNVIAPKVSTIGVKNMARMFWQSYAMQGFNPDVSGWDTSQVEDMNNMFYGCNSAEFNPDFSGWDTRKGTNFQSMFSGCSGAAFAPDLTGWDTSNATNMYGFFNNFAVFTRKKIWVPKTFVATRVSSASNKPFYISPGTNGADVYTDATDAATQGWGTPNAKYTFHYNSTHDDFLNA